MHLSNLTEDEAIELGSMVGALIGLGDRRRGRHGGRARGGCRGRRPTASTPFGDEEAWDILEDIPNGSAAALILLEHHWAVGAPRRLARAGGFRLSDGFISPLDLVGIGLFTAEEAAELARRRGLDACPT